jgi:hypothetical protein
MDKLERHLGARFVTSPVAESVAEQDERRTNEEQSRCPPLEYVGRLRDALQIKNLTAMKILAEELAADPVTMHAGQELAARMRAFDFAGLDALADQWEARNES